MTPEAKSWRIKLLPNQRHSIINTLKDVHKAIVKRISAPNSATARSANQGNPFVQTTLDRRHEAFHGPLFGRFARP